MLDALATSHNRIRTFILLIVCGFLATVAVAIGISDNLPGIVLLFLSAIAFILAFVHPWRAQKQFRKLIWVSGIGLIVFAVLHNVFEAVASMLGGLRLIHGLFDGAGVVSFLIALLLCPVGLLVGVVGTSVMSRREHHSRPGPPASL